MHRGGGQSKTIIAIKDAKASRRPQRNHEMERPSPMSRLSRYEKCFTICLSLDDDTDGRCNEPFKPQS
jgi:hypothetical protein